MYCAPSSVSDAAGRPRAWGTPTVPGRLKASNKRMSGVLKRHDTHFRNGKRISVDMSPNKTYEWPTGTRRDVPRSLVRRETPIDNEIPLRTH